MWKKSYFSKSGQWADLILFTLLDPVQESVYAISAQSLRPKTGDIRTDERACTTLGPQESVYECMKFYLKV